MPQEHPPELQDSEYIPRHERVARYIGEMTVYRAAGISAACWAGLEIGDALMNSYGYDMTFYPKGVAVVATAISSTVAYIKHRDAANKAV